MSVLRVPPTGEATGDPLTDPATHQCSLAAPGGAKLLPLVVRALDDAGVEVEDISLRRPTLDEVFLARRERRRRRIRAKVRTAQKRDDGRGYDGRRNDGRRNEGGRSMTMDITLDPAEGVALRRATAENSGAAYLAASGQVATRTLKKFVRTPALIVAGTARESSSFSSSATCSAGRSPRPRAGCPTSTSWFRASW